jgi:hypothetical protein
MTMVEQINRRGIPLTNRERAQHEAEQAAIRATEKHRVADVARARGMKRRQVRAADGTVQEVWSYESSFHAMHFEDHQIAAAERLQNEWQAAYRGLQGQGFTPGVDGGKSPHGPHMAVVAAQQNLTVCRAYLGARNYDIVVAVAIYGATIHGLAKAASRDHRAVRANVSAAFDDLDGFYSAGNRRKDQTWMAVETHIRRLAEGIAKAERDAR